MSPKAASLAEKNGHTNVRIYNAGMPEWKKFRNVVYVAAQDAAGWLDQHHVIVDIRSSEASRQRHVRSAMSFPLATLQAMDADFKAGKVKTSGKNLPGLVDKKAPVVIYGADDSGRDTLAAFNIVRSWGYSQAAVLEGGFSSWEAAKRPTATGATASRVVYRKKLLPGAVTPEEFTRLVKTGQAVVVDVRSEKEFATGSLPKAISRPLDLLEGSMAQLPRDNLVLVHCRTGSRAAMAYNLLKGHGYTNVRFLNENISIRRGGDFCINCG